MSKIKIEDIEKVIIHWSESYLINDILGCDDNDDIEKEISVVDLEKLITDAANDISSGYDKTSMTITMKDGLVWADNSKFHITKGDTLYSLLNKGQQATNE